MKSSWQHCSELLKIKEFSFLNNLYIHNFQFIKWQYLYTILLGNPIRKPLKYFMSVLIYKNVYAIYWIETKNI